MILTDGPQMLLTPSYHVFEMYKVHQDATLLPLALETDTIERPGCRIPEVSASASLDAQGRVHLSLCNLNAEMAAEVELEVLGTAARGGGTGRRVGSAGGSSPRRRWTAATTSTIPTRSSRGPTPRRPNAGRCA